MAPGFKGNAAGSRRRVIAGAVYFAVVAALAILSFRFVSDLRTGSEAVAAAQEQLDQLIGRSRRASASPNANAEGSPFIRGATITIAGAALEQRVSEAVGKAGGVLTSAQVELDGPDAKDGFVGLATSVEVNQPAIQGLLYDIEAGLPFLFVDKLSIQSPEDFGEPETGRMRMTMTVAGRWRPGE
jgi:general secretion pathway protein M